MTPEHWPTFSSMLPPDYHMHTPLCRHASGEPTQYAARAGELGLKEIGFSDHSPMERDDFDDWRMRSADLPAYVANVEQARREHPSLTIKLGLEVDYIPGCEKWVRALADQQPWDYFIGSVHYVADSWALDNPFALNQWHERGALAVWIEYCRRLTLAAKSRLFDILAHLDLCKKFGFFPKTDWLPLFRPVLAAVCDSGMAVELNTAGLRKDCKEIYPGRGLLEMAAEFKVPITFASDAHSPGEVGMNFREAVELARAVGYREYRVYTQRKPQSVPLD